MFKYFHAQDTLDNILILTSLHFSYPPVKLAKYIFSYLKYFCNGGHRGHLCLGEEQLGQIS